MFGGFASVCAGDSLRKRKRINQPASEAAKLAEQPSLPWKCFSSGSTHGSAVKLGILKSRMATASVLNQESQNKKVTLVRNVFGKFNAVCTAGGIHISQNLALFRGADGGVSSYDFTSEISRGMSRQRAIGIFSHMIAQRESLKRFLVSKDFSHAIALCHWTW